MARKSHFLNQTLITICFVYGIYAIFNAFFNPTTISQLEYSLPVSSVDANLLSNEFIFRDKNVPIYPANSKPRVKIYLYDSPRMFTYGVIEHHFLSRGGRLENSSDLKYPGHQHMAEWYLFSDLLRPDPNRVGSPVVRVSDPDEADLFYVPFFSSLGLIANPTRIIRRSGQDGGEVMYSDEERQVAFVDWLKEQRYWKRNKGRDHVIVAQDPNALYRVIDKIKNSVLLVSDFGRLRADQASLVKDVILPYSHRIKSYNGDDLSVKNRQTLLFFMGNRFRKEGGRIRDILFQILEKEPDVIIKHGTQSRESRRAASNGMHTSKFCLNPAGDTPSACRLFDAIVSLCVPVIVSDSIELPFEDVIDYRKIAIFVDSAMAVKPGFLVSRLRAVTTERLLAYQKKMKEVKRYFEYEDPNGTVNEIWRQVSQKLPLIKLMINREKRLIQGESNEPICSCLCSNVSRTGATTL